MCVMAEHASKGGNRPAKAVCLRGAHAGSEVGVSCSADGQLCIEETFELSIESGEKQFGTRWGQKGGRKTGSKNLGILRMSASGGHSKGSWFFKVCFHANIN